MSEEIPQNAILASVLKELSYKGLVKNQSDFAQKLEYGKSYFSQIMNGTLPLTEKTISKMETLFQLNRDYLKTGKGEIFSVKDLEIKAGKNKEVIALGKHIPTRLKPEEYAEAFGDWQGLPMYNVPITASFVETYRDETIYTPQYYLYDPRFKDCNFGAIITGDSMHSEIRHGDYVACKEITDIEFLVYGDIYYIVAKNGLETCKYVGRVKKTVHDISKPKNRSEESEYDDTKIQLIPYNKSIDPSPIRIDMILRLYKVRGIVRGY